MLANSQLSLHTVTRRTRQSSSCQAHSSVSQDAKISTTTNLVLNEFGVECEQGTDIRIVSVIEMRPAAICHNCADSAMQLTQLAWLSSTGGLARWHTASRCVGLMQLQLVV